MEFLFHFDFDAHKAYARAGITSNPKSINSRPYKLLTEAPIQAAIQRRRLALREKRALSREERLQILEECARSSRADWRSRMAAIKLYNEMVGDGVAPQSNLREVDRLTVGAIRAMDRASLIDAINRGLITTARALNIDLSPVKIADDDNGKN